MHLQARGERAAIARQSAVAMSEVMGDEKLALALEEVHSLTQQLHTQEEEYKQKLHKLKVCKNKNFFLRKLKNHIIHLANP